MTAEVARYWRHAAVEGVDLLRARYVTHRYGRHAHETYTFGLIEAGVEEFAYGGGLLRASAGAVALLNPDVVHTGQAATPAGWRYRVLYPKVSVVTDVAAELGWRAGHAPVPADGALRPGDRGAAAQCPPGRRARRTSSRPPRCSRTALAGLLRAHAAGGPAARARSQ